MGLGFTEEELNYVPGNLGWEVANIKMDLTGGQIPMALKIKSQSSPKLSFKSMTKESSNDSEWARGQR